MTLADRVHLSSEIPILVKSSDNDNLFFTSCLYLSSDLLYKRLKPATFLGCTGLQGLTNNDVLYMAGLIRQKVGWSSLPVTLLAFISLFSPFLTPQPSHSALRPVYQLIVTSQFGIDFTYLLPDIAFTQFRPSVMAVAAMLVFTTKELPDQLEHFKRSVTTDDHFVPLQTMINKCQMMLEPLYSSDGRMDGVKKIDGNATSMGRSTS